MALPDSFLQELKMKTDIEDIVSSYVTLKRRGSTYVGLCPFHNEKTASFTVYPDTQSFYCFGCSAGGGIIEFVKRIENLDYIDAVKLLAQRAGLQMPEDGVDDSIGRTRRKILEINRETAKFYHSYMMSPEGRRGLDYFLSRKLTPKTITKFGLGYAPDEWDALLKHLKGLGFSISDMLAAGVIKRSQKGSYFDFFRNRVMTPIIDIRGNVIAFGGRVLDNSPNKYMNTIDTLVYKKTNEVFGLNIAKDSGSSSIILCEGYMDVIAMHQAGFTNCIAGCGTALTAEQVKLINRYYNEVILCYDTDGPGRKAVDKAIRLFEKTDMKIRIPQLSGGKDPDEIINNLGPERFKAMLESSSNEIEYAILNFRSNYDLNSLQGKNDFLNEVIKLLATSSPIEQDLYISKLCEELQVDKASAKAQLTQYSRRNKFASQRKQQRSELTERLRQERKESYELSATPRKIKAEDRLIGLLIKYPSCVKYTEGFNSDMLSSGFIKKAYEITVRLINDSVPTDIIQYEGDLSGGEIGRLSGIIARSSDSLNPENEFKDCINAITEEYNAANNDAVNLNNDDDFLRELNKLTSKNNNNT